MFNPKVTDCDIQDFLDMDGDIGRQVKLRKIITAIPKMLYVIDRARDYSSLRVDHPNMLERAGRAGVLEMALNDLDEFVDEV